MRLVLCCLLALFALSMAGLEISADKRKLKHLKKEAVAEAKGSIKSAKQKLAAVKRLAALHNKQFLSHAVKSLRLAREERAMFRAFKRAFERAFPRLLRHQRRKLMLKNARGAFMHLEAMHRFKKKLAALRKAGKGKSHEAKQAKLMAALHGKLAKRHGKELKKLLAKLYKGLKKATEEALKNFEKLQKKGGKKPAVKKGGKKPTAQHPKKGGKKPVEKGGKKPSAKHPKGKKGGKKPEKSAMPAAQSLAATTTSEAHGGVVWLAIAVIIFAVLSAAFRYYNQLMQKPERYQTLDGANDFEYDEDDDASRITYGGVYV